MKPNEASQDSPRRRFQSIVWRQIREHSIELSLFLCLWFAYGVALNSRNQSAFNLQQAGVEAMVERRHFYLEGSATPQLQMRPYYDDGGKPFGDVFMYRGHQYAAKQPGQFMAGALVYFFLRLFGLTYANNYFLTSALVSFFTTSLITAVAAVAVFGIVREFTGGASISWPLAGALIYGLGTVAFVYSGIAYHDCLGSGYLAIAFYLAVLMSRRQTRDRFARLLAAGGGLLLGLTITTSMLPFFMACIVVIYVISLRRWDLTALLLLGGAIGIAPLLLYNSVSFGNPLLNSYMAGGYPESFIHLNLHNSLEKARLYASEISLYVPIAWLGILGLPFFPRGLRREQLALVGLLIAQAIQVLNIDSHGGCHYGPRFLLPSMPYACIGLAGFHYLRETMMRMLVVSAIAVTAAFSIFVNTAGAIYGAMYCDVQVYALWPALKAISSGAWRNLPLAGWLLIPLCLSVLLFAYSVRNYRGRPAPAL
jgi:hypothetical protein